MLPNAFEPHTGMYIILAIGSTTAYLTAHAFWLDNCTPKPRSAMHRRLFGSTRRQIGTSVAILLGTLLAAVVAFPSGASDGIPVGVGITLSIVLFQTLQFIPFKIGPYSFALRDRVIVDKLARALKEGSLTDEYVRAAISCIISEAEKGNATSQEVLEGVWHRSDEVGESARRLFPDIKFLHEENQQ